jgi:hypothetical protein
MKLKVLIKYFELTGIVLLIFTLVGCGTIRIGNASFGYDLKGAQINPKCKTAFVDYFKNQAALVQPALALKLTDKLKDKLLSQTALKLTNVTNGADIYFQGTIENYATQPMAPQSGNVIAAAMNRLTVSIKVKYSNAIDNKWDYETNFSRFIDYASDRNLNDVENSSEYDTMLDQLIQDIFDKAFVNW